MRCILFAFLAIAATVFADESVFPITPASEDTPAPNTVTGNKLSFCIVDNGGWGMSAVPTKFWVAASGRVYTQSFERRQDANVEGVQFKYEDIRYGYQLDPDELTHLKNLIDRLRVDARALRERFLVPGERTRWIAFGMSPYGDLFIREKHASDHWKEFSAVTTFLSRIHASKKKIQKPSHVGVSVWGAPRWEPAGFVSSEVIRSLRYIGSDRYNRIIETQNQRSEQDGAGQAPTAPKSK